jgi:hypothetical protein
MQGPAYPDHSAASILLSDGANETVLPIRIRKKNIL